DLTAQFTDHSVRKKYLLVTDRPVRERQIKVESTVVRAGESYVSRPLHAGGQRAETHFWLIGGGEAPKKGVLGGNPKAENRRPKEIRSAKPETRRGASEVGWYEM